jgi:hypothetical protein
VEEDEPGNEQKKMKSYLRQFIECVSVAVGGCHTAMADDAVSSRVSVGWMCMVDGDICESCMQSEVWSVIVLLVEPQQKKLGRHG